MPVLFVGHGSPLNAITENEFSRGWAALGALLPRPRAVLAVSAHWYLDATCLTGNEHPPTIHDFSGFPEALDAVRYPAPGSRALAERVRELLGLDGAAVRSDWGLDHGTWSVLRWIYPAAEVPVVQLSLDAGLTPRQHVDLARSLRALRRERVLVMGSGNVTHDLREAFRRMRDGDPSTPEVSRRFDEAVRAALVDRDTDRLVGLWPGTEDGRRNHPTPDHWLPLLYAAGVADPEDEVEFPIEGFDLGLSMRCVLFGRA
jgi:4,5-DOPA dioxygenase extradiol